ncbi:MAG: hypothetical protein CMJ48_04755 [Planctomycetaceae bacterium]|nr:hypothetical protein [Planctomycetaceae bacterium]
MNKPRPNRQPHEFGIESRDASPDPNSSSFSQEMADIVGDDVGPLAGETESLAEAIEVFDDAPPAPRPPRRLPGPGLPEAIAWTFAVLPIQVIGAVFGVVLMFIVHIAAQKGASTFESEITENAGSSPVFMGGVQGVMVLVAVIAVILRLGPKNVARRLGIVGFPPKHLLIIALTMLPTIIVCSQLHVGATIVWEEVVEAVPQLKLLDDMQTSEAIKPLIASSPWWALMLLIAVAPAIGEELIFRGIIGRGLLARWGLVPGIAITSFLFAIVHVHPAHAFALLPLAVFMHVSYVATGSILAPMLIHFVNNGLSVTIIKAVETMPAAEVLADDAPPPMLFSLAATVVVVAALGLLWKGRTRFVAPSGRYLTPGYITVEPPPAHLGAVRTFDRSPLSLTLLFAGGLLAFAAAAAIMGSGVDVP